MNCAADLTAAVIRLNGTGGPGHDTGAAVRTWFFEQVMRHSPELLPTENHQQRPLTLSTVLHNSGAPYLRVTALHQSAGDSLLNNLLPHLPEKLTLLDRVYTIKGWTTDTTAHPDAGQTDYTALITAARRHAFVSHFTFDLVSPVTFRQKGLNQSRLSAVLFYGSLVRRWETFTREPFVLPLDDFIREHIQLRQPQLKVVSRLVPYATSGSVGRVTFVVCMPEEHSASEMGDWHHQIRMIHALSHFAFYAGVGASTTYGMGQVRVALP